MKYEIGDILEGKVTGIIKYGAFVELPDETVGMVHISEVSFEYIDDISTYLTLNQKVKIKVLSILENGKVSLSIKKAIPKNDVTTSDNNNKQIKANSQKQNIYKGSSFATKSQDNSNLSFEDMLSKFITTSDERNSAVKKQMFSRRGDSSYKRGGR